MKFFITIMLFTLSLSASAKKFSLMSYNVENLFDTLHDEGKEDYTYLPLKFKQASEEVQNYCHSLANEGWQKSCLYTDWSEDVLKQKLLNIGKVIKRYNWGRGADILVLTEVENKRVLKQLVDTALKGKGYKYISLIEGPDKRGIDVGVISKYPIVAEKLHKINLEGIAKETRGILEVNIEINGKIITVLGNHWPSQHNPPEARVEAAKVMKQVAEQATGEFVLAAGDFNTLDSETPNGIKEVINPVFYNAQTEALNKWKRLFIGTHWFGGEWNALDKIFVLKSKKKAPVKYRSFRIFAKKFLFGTKKWTDRDTGKVTLYKGVPKSFNYRTKKGYSDHLPIAVKFEL